MSTINEVVHQLQTQRKRTEMELEKLNLAIKALASLNGKPEAATAGISRKPRFSRTTRARMAAAQRARWAKVKAKKKK